MSKARLAARGQEFVRLIQDREEEEIIFDTDDFSAGWCGDENIRRMAINSWYDANGVVYLGGDCLVSNSYSEYSITPPDSNKILAITSYQDPTEGVMLLRVTRNKIYKVGSSGFVEITPSGILANAGGDNDYFTFTAADNRFFFSNDGVDPIREINAVTSTYKALGDAPRYKYIISAFNRIIAANFRDSVGGDNPVQVGWSGDENYGEWDPLVDGTAGNTPLVTSPSDTSDEITGLVAYENYIVVFRQKSIWLGQFQASGSNPFYFYPIPQAVGCDCPRTVQQTEDGKLCWYNSITGGVYSLVISGGQLEDLTDIEPRRVKWALRALLLNGSANITGTYGTYNKNTKCYILTNQLGGIGESLHFEYSFVHKNWVKPNRIPATCIYVPDLPTSSITIDELTGTIDNLAGEIDELGGIPSIISTMYGSGDGKIYLQAPFIPNGAISPDPSFNHVGWNVTTKLFTLPSEYTNWSEVAFSYTPYLSGTFAVRLGYGQVSNGPTSFPAIKTVVVQDGDLTGVSQVVRLRKPFRVRELRVEILSQSTGPLISFDRLTIKGYRGAESKSASNPGKL